MSKTAFFIVLVMNFVLPAFNVLAEARAPQLVIAGFIEALQKNDTDYINTYVDLEKIKNQPGHSYTIESLRDLFARLDASKIECSITAYDKKMAIVSVRMNKPISLDFELQHQSFSQGKSMDNKIKNADYYKIIGVHPPKYFLINESAWSRPSHSLSAKLVFECENSPSRAKIIHPKVLLRNDSHVPIKFIQCVYDAGEFSIKIPDGNVVEKYSGPRSGPQGAQIVVISPSEIFEFDAYDYGYGFNTDTSTYVFNTHSFQAILKPGRYVVDYSLIMDTKRIKKMLQRYDWLKSSTRSIWTGTISIPTVEILLH